MPGLGYSRGFRLCGTINEPRYVNHLNGRIYNTTKNDVDIINNIVSGLKVESKYVLDVLSKGIIMPLGSKSIITNYGDGNCLDDIHIDITSRCSVGCSYCYQNCGSNPSDLPLDIAKLVIDQAKSLGGARIALSGGDPLLYPYFKEIVKYVYDKEMVLTAVFTNGDHNLELLNHIPKYTNIIASYNPSLNDHTSLDAIKKISHKYRMTVNTLTKNGNELDSIYAELLKIKIFRWRVGIVRPVGRGKALPSETDFDALEKAYTKLFDRYLDDYINKRHKFELQIGFAFQSRFLDAKKIDLYPINSTCCYYKKESMTVKWDGSVTPCSMDFTKVGSANNLKDAWNNMKSSYRSIVASTISGCSKCELIRMCNGGCRICVNNPNVDIDPIGCFTYKFLSKIMPKLVDNGVKIIT